MCEGKAATLEDPGEDSKKKKKIHVNNMLR